MVVRMTQGRVGPKFIKAAFCRIEGRVINPLVPDNINFIKTGIKSHDSEDRQNEEQDQGYDQGCSFLTVKNNPSHHSVLSFILPRRIRMRREAVFKVPCFSTERLKPSASGDSHPLPPP